MGVMEFVDNVEITLRAVIRRGPFEDNGGDWFDWLAQNGDESSETFDSAEEAATDFKDRYR